MKITYLLWPGVGESVSLDGMDISAQLSPIDDEFVGGAIL